MSDNIYELKCQVVFLEILERYPTDIELTEYSTRLSDSVSPITQDDLRTILKNTTEYLKKIGSHCGDIEYDNSSNKLSGSNFSSSNFSGLTLANGKLALITSSEPLKMEHSLISTNFDINDLGTYSHNTTETFDYTTLNFFDRDSSKVSVGDVKQSLNITSANLNTTYSVSNIDLVQDNVVKLSISSDLRVLRHLPFCTMQTVSIYPDKAVNLDIYHNLNTPTDKIQNVRYNNNLINASIAGNTTSLYFFQANGIIKNYDKTISTCCGYIFNSNPTPEEITSSHYGAYTVNYKGYNISQTNTDNAFTKFTLNLTPNTYNIFHIITSTMTQLDFPKPDIETQRVLINTLSYTPNEIISNHVYEWGNIWKSSITITPKTGITTEESNKIDTFNKFIKLSLYNIYSAIRDDFNVDINPLNISSIDLSGHIFWNGELWLIPVLTFLMPKAARSLLDYRYYQLENSIKLAAAHGYKGSKYAYQNDVIGYNNVFWNTIAPLQIFNTALISIAIWNYYRVTRDLDWLTKKGFEMLKNNADFFVSKLEPVYIENSTVIDYYSINNVYSIDGYIGNDNSFTNYLAKLVLSYALQAKYELNYVYSVDWKTYIDLIKLNITENTNTGYYNIINTNSDNTPEILDLLEPLLILHPYYSKFLFSITNETNFLYKYDVETIKNNLNWYSILINENYKQNSFNKILQATLYGRIAQLDSTYNYNTYIEKFETEMDNVFNNCTLQPWTTFYNSQYTKTYNDIGVSSMFILGILTSIMGLRITGSVDDTKYYTEDFGIKSETANILPKTWKSIEVTGIGSDSSLDYCIINKLIYP